MKEHLPVLSTIERAAQEGLKELVKEVRKIAVENAPKDDGTLRKSVRSRVDDLEGYVRFTAPHAWLQHEMLDYQHSVGGAKYLERAIEEVDAPSVMVSAVSTRLRRGRR